MRTLLLIGLMTLLGGAPGQQTVALDDLSAFRAQDGNWKVVGNVAANPDKHEDMAFEGGTGILANDPTGGKTNLLTQMEHGDMDLSLEFMMPQGSNSGLYLQGRYEIQLYDSWGVDRPTFADCGGVYAHWDASRPKGEEWVDGVAPRTNASLAPGLWQKLEVSFQAPRFDASGTKVAHARLLSVKLNGILIHENLVLTGPTGGAIGPEAAMGPIMIQGDHGPVAFRNIEYTLFEQEVATVSDISYDVYLGKFQEAPDFNTLEPDRSGKSEALTQEVAGESQDFILQLKGNLEVPKDGTYEMDFQVSGFSAFVLDGQPVTAPNMWSQQAPVELTAGKHAFELFYSKDASWYPNSLGWFISGPGLRRQPLHRVSSMAVTQPVRPIYVKVGNRPRLLRSFVDIQEKGMDRERIVHPVNVGLPSGTHYTFDTDRANWLQFWRGKFLNATPMWNSRGDGSSRPRGATLLMGNQIGMGMLTEAGDWPKEMPSSVAYDFQGYELDEAGEPIFLYQIAGADVRDQVRLQKDKTLVRSLSFSTNPAEGTMLLLGKGEEIADLGKGLYQVDKSYYLRLPKFLKPERRTIKGMEYLFLPLSYEKVMISYELFW